MDSPTGSAPNADAPTTLAQLVAALATHGALVVSTRGSDGLEARTTIHLDGDVTTTITAQCLRHVQKDELFRRHDEAMRRVSALLRAGADGATRVAAMVAGIVAAVTTAAAIIAEQSWLHILVTLGCIGGVSVLVARVVRPLGVRFLIRSARAEIGRLRL